MAKATIIGAGLMGSAMAWPLSDNGHEVHLVGTHLDTATIESCIRDGYHPRLKRKLPRGVKAHFLADLDESLEGSGVIVSGVNSMGVRWIAELLSHRAAPGQTVLSITKGLEARNDGKAQVLPDIIGEAMPSSLRKSVKFAAVGGPCIAGELAGRRQTCVMFGSREIGVAREMASLFSTSYYHPTPVDDLLGLEVGVALKNAYTVAVGIAYGTLEKSGGVDEAGASMHNLAAALFAQGCREMRVILGILGGTESFAGSLPGAGDLYVTSMGGRTVRFGKLLGSGKSYDEARAIMEGETLESIEIIRCMSRLIPVWEGKKSVARTELPLMRALIEVVIEKKPLVLPMGELFR